MGNADASSKANGDLTGICFRIGAGNRHQGQADSKAPKGVPLEERRKEMRKHRNNGYGGCRYATYQSYMNANTINVTNVTNTTNVTHVAKVAHVGHSYWHGRLHEVRKMKRGHGGGERRDSLPKLTRFCASGGLLDYDKASRMSEGEMCDEAVRVVKHSTRKMASAWGGVARNLFGGLSDMVGAFFS